MLLVVLFEGVPLGLGTVATDGGNVDEPSSVLDESPSFHWDFEVSDVVQAEVDELLQFCLTQEVPDGLPHP